MQQTIELTDNALTKVKELLGHEETGKGLRIMVKAGGCAGYSYALTFDSKQETDREFDFNGLKVFVDNEALEMIKGSKVDYVDSLQGAGFKFENPNAQSTCGCGKSFGN